MFLKQETPEMDDYEKNFDSKGKILYGYPCKNVTFLHINILLFQNFLTIFLFWDKKTFFSGGGRGSPPPLSGRVW